MIFFVIKKKENVVDCKKIGVMMPPKTKKTKKNSSFGRLVKK